VIETAPAHGFVLAVSGLAVEARIAAGPGVRTIASGGDAQRLAHALEAHIAQGAVALISFGIAGGLAEQLEPGTTLVARNIVTHRTRVPVDAAWSRALHEHLPGAIVADLAGADAILHQPLDKRALHRATGAAAVDMESHVVAAIATAHRLPFAAFRVIADPVRRSLPHAALVGLRPNGRVDHRAVVLSLARKPHQLPGLLRTAADARAALRALSRGRRLLGLGLAYPNLDQLVLDVA
jgi:adenosylhomocysteine nucleosidase